MMFASIHLESGEVIEGPLIRRGIVGVWIRGEAVTTRIFVPYSAIRTLELLAPDRLAELKAERREVRI